jgi:hypothetical protein
MDSGKMSKEKLGSCLNFTGTPNVAVPHMFVEPHRVVVVGLPFLVVNEVAGADFMLKNLLRFLAPVPPWTWARCRKRRCAAA